MNSVGPHADDPIRERHSSNSVNTAPTATPEASSSQHHPQNPEPASASAIDAPATRSIRQRKRPSQRRIEANRRNAKRSTGPRTARGKKAVSRNAIKHGLLAREVVILDGCGAENKEDFAALQSQLIEHYKPVGPIEAMLVQKIAVLLWRQARVLRAENGEIRKRADLAQPDVLLEAAAESGQTAFISHMRLMHMQTSRRFGGHSSAIGTSHAPDQEVRANLTLSERERLGWHVRAQSDLKRDYFGLMLLASIWRDVKRQISETGSLSEATERLLVATIGLADYPLVMACTSFRSQTVTKNESHKSTNRERDMAVRDAVELKKNELIAMIDQELQWIDVFKEAARIRRPLRVESETLSRSLPPEGPSDKILRYDAHIERQLYRAMHELERLQRRRMGEAVPPPLAVRFN